MPVPEVQGPNSGGRQPKPERLSAAIDEIGSVVARLNRLRDQIVGQTPDNKKPKEPGGSSASRCLADIINHGPDEICDNCDRAREVINDIQDTLF